MNMVAISFVVYTLGIAAVGIYSTRFASKTADDFFLAGRGLGPWVAALSSSASAESGWVTLGLVGTAFKLGVCVYWFVPFTAGAFVFNWLIVAPRLRARAARDGSLTVIDVLAASHTALTALLIRILSVVIILTMLTAYVAAQLNAAGKTFQATFGWNYMTGVLVGTGIVVVYTVLGGFRAVAWTDVIQSVFMIAAVVILPAIIVIKIGGMSEVADRLRASEPTLTHVWGDKSGWAVVSFLALCIGISLGYPGQPHVLVRLMAIRDAAEIRRSAIISTIWVIILFTGAISLGICARAWYGTLADPEQALPIAAADAEILPGVVGGMMIAAIMAAICSTADSQLLVSASAVSHDILVGLLGCELSIRTRRWLDRAAVVLVALVATMIAAREVRQVFDFVLDYGWAGLGAGFGPALVLTLWWPGVRGAGILSGMFAGVVTIVVWRQFPSLQSNLYNLVPGIIVATVVTVGVSLLGRRGGNEYPSR
jgi:sodium/proline symporter